MDRNDYKAWARHLEDIREDVEELDRLIGRILDLSKLDIHETPLRLESLDLSVILNELLERFRPTISQKGLRLDKELFQDHPIEGDKEALSTAFSNIVGNAVKYTTEGGGLRIQMDSTDKEVVIGVTNTFEVMSEEDLARIFEPFYQAKKTRKTGSGLGLAITKKIIEKHGGKIEACNVPEGLKIEIRLPTVAPQD